MKRIQYFNVIVEVDLECIELTDDHVGTIRDHIECSFDEGNYIVIDKDRIELSDDDLLKVLEGYRIEKRLKDVTK